MAKTQSTKTESRTASKAREILAQAAAQLAANGEAGEATTEPVTQETPVDPVPPVVTEPAPQTTTETPPTQEAPASVHPVDARIAYAVRDGFRPTSGAALFAHTAVVLARSGISTTAPIPTALARTLMGDTAYNYHRKNGNFDVVGDTPTRKGGLVLTPKGVDAFGKRRPQQEYVSAWENVLLKGETDERVLKNANGIIKVA